MKSKTIALLISLLLGAFATMTQVILFREQLQILDGNELGLSLLLFGWLVGLTAGAPLPHKLRIEERLDAWLRLTLPAIPLLLAAGITLIRLSPEFFSISPLDKPSPMQTAFIALLPVIPAGAFFGFAFPLMTLVLKRARGTDTQAATLTGSVFTMESLGGVVAGLLISLQLLVRYDPYHVSFFMLAITILVLFVYDRCNHFSKIWLCLTITVLAAYLAGLPSHIGEWSENLRWNSRHAGFELVRSLETPYQRLEIGTRDDRYTVFGNGSPLFSFPDEYESVHWAHTSLSQRPDPESILLLGSRGGDLIRNYAFHHPKRTVLAEMDPGILTIVEGLREEPVTSGVTVSFSDPRRLLSSLDSSERFSAIIVNQPDPANGLLNRLYTREFFQAVSSHLEDEGVLAITLTGTPNYESGDAGFYAGTLYWTLKDVFSEVLVVPGTEWWFFASPSLPLVSNHERIALTFERAEFSSPHFHPEFFSLYYDEGRIRQVQDVLQKGEYYPRNTDRRPLCYLYNLIRWSKQHGYLKGLSIEKLARVSEHRLWLGAGTAILLYLLISLGCRAFIPRGSRHARAALTTLAATGLSVMGAEIAILLYYQSVAGCLYQQVGLFFGAFMLGLAIGAAQGVRQARNSTRNTTDLIVRADLYYCIALILTPLLLFLLSYWNLPTNTTSFLLLLWLTLLAGLSGCLFPLIAKSIEQDKSAVSGTERDENPVSDIERDKNAMSGIAGRIVACDNLGGAFGAIITGVLLIPLFGTTLTLCIFFIIKAISAVSVYQGVSPLLQTSQIHS